MKKEIYFFSIFNWDGNLLHREHMLAKSFLKLGYKVNFVQRIHNPFRIKTTTYDGITIYSIFALPYLKGRLSFVFFLNDLIIKLQLKKFLYLKKQTLFFVSSPLWAKSVSVFEDENQLVYDMSDDLLQFTTNQKWFLNLKRYENFLIDKSDAVIITSDKLKNKLPAKKRFIIVENGVDVDAFKNAAPVKKGNYKGRLVGFIGGINDWVNLHLVSEAAKKYPKENFLLIGPTNRKQEVDRIVKQQRNLKYLGPVSWKNIGEYFAILDVGLIPFVNEGKYPRLATVNSNKIYQYAYFGYPVVATRFNQTKKLEDYFYIARNEKEFIKLIAVALNENDSTKKIKRQTLAKESSWDNRTRVILEFLSQ